MLLQSAFVLFALASLSIPVDGLDEESAKEMKCFDIKKTVPMSFEMPADYVPQPMYFPMMSRLQLYREAQDITKKDFKDITEDELYYDGCVRFQGSEDGTCISTGFNGKSLKRPIRPLDPGMEKVEFGDKDGKGWHGHCAITLSGKTFIFQTCCSNGNEMHWGVVSTEKEMSKENVKLIHEHAESLGFKREYFTSLRYDTCDKKGKSKDEL